VVARSGLVRPRDPDTVDAWRNRWRAEEMDGLTSRTGRGRTPAVFPLAPNA